MQTKIFQGSGDRVTGLSLHSIECPCPSSIVASKLFCLSYTVMFYCVSVRVCLCLHHILDVHTDVPNARDYTAPTVPRRKAANTQLAMRPDDVVATSTRSRCALTVVPWETTFDMWRPIWDRIYLNTVSTEKIASCRNYTAYNQKSILFTTHAVTTRYKRIVSRLIVWISPLLLLSNAQSNRLILHRFIVLGLPWLNLDLILILCSWSFTVLHSGLIIQVTQCYVVYCLCIYVSQFYHVWE